MAAISHGADTESLRGVGRELASSSERLADLATSGRSMAQVLAEHWSGADLEHFVGQGWPDAEKAVHAASQMLRGLGEEAQRNAEQQDDTSAGGGPAGGRFAPSGALPGDRFEGDHPGMDAPRDEIYGDLDPEIEQKWNDLTEEQKRAVLQEMVDEEAERYGIDPPPKINFKEGMESNEFGVWNDFFKTLTINADLVDSDPRMAINTAIHEMRHAGQSEAVRDANPIFPWDSPEYGEGMTPEEVQEWKDNNADYKSPPGWWAEMQGEDVVEQRWQEYWDQPVEVDAREEGKDYVENLTPEELDRLIEESGG